MLLGAWSGLGGIVHGGGAQALRLTPGQSSASLTNPGTPRGGCKGLSGEKEENTLAWCFGQLLSGQHRLGSWDFKTESEKEFNHHN